MSDHISMLPNDILNHIFSKLTLRDAVRTRSLIYSWRFVYDTRSCLQFDAFNVFGKETNRCFLNYENQCDEFVETVDRFMEEVWRGTKISRLHVHFHLGKEHASHIDRWILTAFRMGVEEVRLCFPHHSDPIREIYLFPSSYLADDFENPPSSLKCLCLENCNLHLSPRCKSLLSRLTTLNLSHVPLHPNGVRCILSGGLNLTSLTFSHCSLPATLVINGELLCLKELAIDEKLIRIKLNCPNLESFKFHGDSARMYFAHVPKLRKLDILFRVTFRPCSEILGDLTRNVPQLEALSLCMMTEEIPPMSQHFTRSCLRKLDLHIRIPSDFDVFTIVHMLNVSPFLEILHLKMSRCLAGTIQRQGRYYERCSPLQLKEVKIEGFSLCFNTLTLVLCLLNKAVALEHMIIDGCSQTAKEMLTSILQTDIINTSAQVIIQ